MKKTTERLQRVARDLFAKGEIDYLLGYGKGSRFDRRIPLFVKDELESKALCFDSFCSNSLPTYLFLNSFQGLSSKGEKKVGIVVKGCDSKALLRVLHDHLVKREDLVILGIPCSGILDPRKISKRLKTLSWKEIKVYPQKVVVITDEGEKEFTREDLLDDKCLYCDDPNPVLYDMLLGEPVDSLPKGDPYQAVKEIEKMSSEEKRTFWTQQFKRCIRCYACRNVCPACNCRSCIFQEEEGNWLGKGVDEQENLLFHFTRTFHVAGRCIECGECERVCPMEIPLQLLNHKVWKDVKDLFFQEPLSKEEDLNTRPPLSSFKEQDREEFL